MITTEQSALLFFVVLVITTVWFLKPVVGGIWRFLFKRGIAPTDEWFQNFNLDRYKGLTHLFDPQDFEFLKRQPGYAPELLARLKSDRLDIAEGYLRQLETDVRLLLNFANRESGRSDHDQHDFSAFLLKQEFIFASKIGFIRVELALMRLGLLRRIEFRHFLESLRPLVTYSQTTIIFVS